MINDHELIRYWIDQPLDSAITRSLNRMAKAPGVKAIAVMPDVHLSKKICNGVAIATTGSIFPEAVGGDIGCGYLMAQVQGATDVFGDPRASEKVLVGLTRNVPIIRHRAATMPATIPRILQQMPLSSPSLEKLKSRDAKVQLGTLGRGNHFVEFQQSSDGEIHLLIHSGSRAVGQTVLAHHLRSAPLDDASKLFVLDSNSRSGKAYLDDMEWARMWAVANRLRMLQTVNELLAGFDLSIDFDSMLDRDHNHVQAEQHDGQQLWIHRKGAQRIEESEIGIIPGSMGSASFLVSGRGYSQAFATCSHGAGRRMSRTEAAKRISSRDLKNQMQQVCFDTRKTRQLCDEAPAAYKDIRKVMRAQKVLVRIEEERTPLLNFKAAS